MPNYTQHVDDHYRNKEVQRTIEMGKPKQENDPKDRKTADNSNQLGGGIYKDPARGYANYDPAKQQVQATQPQSSPIPVAVDPANPYSVAQGVKAQQDPRTKLYDVIAQQYAPPSPDITARSNMIQGSEGNPDLIQALINAYREQLIGGLNPGDLKQPGWADATRSGNTRYSMDTIAALQQQQKDYANALEGAKYEKKQLPRDVNYSNNFNAPMPVFNPNLSSQDNLIVLNDWLRRMHEFTPGTPGAGSPPDDTYNG